MNDLIEKSQKEIEPYLSSKSYKFIKEIQLGGQRFMCEYTNKEKKKILQIVYELYSRNAFCKRIYEEDIKEVI